MRLPRNNNDDLNKILMPTFAIGCAAIVVYVAVWGSIIAFVVYCIANADKIGNFLIRLVHGG